MKKYLIVFAILSIMITGCCNDSCITEEKCKDKFPCPEYPTSTCDCAAGVVLATIDDATAKGYISKAKTDMTSFVSGVFVSNCQMCLINSEKPQEVCVITGLMGDGTAIIIGRYINEAGSDTVYVNITGPVVPGGPLCPPGTKCS
jgi:hypothetical protein